MNDGDRVIEVLLRIEANQQKALQAQAQHLEIAQAQLDRSRAVMQESMDLQRAAVRRQAQIVKLVLPLIAVLVALLAWLLLKHRVLLG